MTACKKTEALGFFTKLWLKAEEAKEKLHCLCFYFHYNITSLRHSEAYRVCDKRCWGHFKLNTLWTQVRLATVTDGYLKFTSASFINNKSSAATSIAKNRLNLKSATVNFSRSCPVSANGTCYIWSYPPKPDKLSSFVNRSVSNQGVLLRAQYRKSKSMETHVHNHFPTTICSRKIFVDCFWKRSSLT